MEHANDERITRALDLIEERLDRRLTVAELAGAVGLSVTQFTRLFRQARGTTPGAFMRQLRLTRGRLLLERTSLSVAEIMRQIGVSDRSHFGRDFRLAYGASPRALRMHLRDRRGRETG